MKKPMTKEFIKSRMIDIFVFGTLLWFIGYIASIIIFPFVSQESLGWILTGFLTPITILIVYLRFRNRKLDLFCYFMTGIFWVGIAALLDYIFIVKLLNPENYYKLDVYIYYTFTFLIPFVIGLINVNKKK